MQGGQEELLTTAAPALVDDVLRQFGHLRLRAHGCSMFPAIKSGDILSIRHCTAGELQPGDVVLLRDGGRLIAHRLIGKAFHGAEERLVTRGDSIWANDPARPMSSLLGQVEAIIRDGRVLKAPFRSTRAERLYGLAVSECRRWLRVGSAALPPQLREVAQRVLGTREPAS